VNNYSFPQITEQHWVVSGRYWHVTGDNKLMVQIVHGTKSPVIASNVSRQLHPKN